MLPLIRGVKVGFTHRLAHQPTKNKMGVFNPLVCFGPTYLTRHRGRPKVVLSPSHHFPITQKGALLFHFPHQRPTTKGKRSIKEKKGRREEKKKTRYNRTIRKQKTLFTLYFHTVFTH